MKSKRERPIDVGSVGRDTDAGVEVRSSLQHVAIEPRSAREDRHDGSQPRTPNREQRRSIRLCPSAPVQSHGKRWSIRRGARCGWSRGRITACRGAGVIQMVAPFRR